MPKMKKMTKNDQNAKIGAKWTKLPKITEIAKNGQKMAQNHQKSPKNQK
jgi:hypothetical protein